MALTEKRLRILNRAAADDRGLVSRPYMTGFERVAWDRNVAHLVAQQFLVPYRHGGFEITVAGREALKLEDGR